MAQNYRHQEERIPVYNIGTRGSQLALWQANTVASLLDVQSEIVIITTSGDKFLDIPLQGQTEPGFFTKEIESQLLAGLADIAVHSLKDIPTALHKDLELVAFMERASVADLLLIHPDWHDPDALIPVKAGCKVGATSLRRQSLLQLYGPHAVPAMLRGNVPSRIEKCKNGEYGAIVLAQAGVERLELDTTPLIVYRLNPVIWLPAPGQGVVTVQTRKYHYELKEHVVKLNHQPSHDAVTIERQLLTNFEGGCHTAFGSYAVPAGEKWDVYMGMDRPDDGWGQIVLKGKTLAEMARINAANLPADQWKPLAVDQKENLCREILL